MPSELLVEQLNINREQLALHTHRKLKLPVLQLLKAKSLTELIKFEELLVIHVSTVLNDHFVTQKRVDGVFQNCTNV